MTRGFSIKAMTRIGPFRHAHLVVRRKPSARKLAGTAAVRQSDRLKETLRRRQAHTLNGTDPTLYTYDKAGRLVTVTYLNEITKY
jgi:YD repeat-containing protein